MSRFSRSAGTQFLVWWPPEGHLKIEYASTLFRELRLEAASGTLYGLNSKERVRVVTGGAHADSQDPRLANLEPVGIFAIRDRGDVFLTQQDLERFEKSESRVAVVVAGPNAGFFVRERNGSIQSTSPHPSWMPAAAIAIVAILLAGSWSLRRPPLGLSIHESADQLRISWTRAAGQLQIIDGSSRHAIPVAPTMSGITYAPETTDIQVRLTSGRRVENARFVSRDPLAEIRKEIASLETEAAALAAQSTQNIQRAADLEKSLSKIKRAH